MLLAGFIIDTVKLNNQTFTTAKGKSDVLLLKIHDIEIYRAYVKKGPYCAGDTIKIPYTKEGTFTGNQFIAQLSDVNGNFDGNERELGRLTSDTNGVIKGLLPLFDVESGPNYRIRIISTNPVVQSYYKYDTLRLLIYSKDTANAGKDTTICAGQTVKITTTGGSRWHWSPGNLVQDSTKKTTVATPKKTTKFRIIISDSSGCGKIDTAYKTIFVNPPLKITSPKDTVVCKNTKVTLKIIPSGGLGKGYTYQWLTSTNNLLRSTDTMSISISGLGKLKAVLFDGCSLNDTTIINFSLPVLPFKQLLKSKVICKNNPTLLTIKPSVGSVQDFSYQWLSLKNVLLRNTDTLTCKVTSEDSLKIILTYKCSGISDTSFVHFSFPVFPFKQLLHDTLVCRNSRPLLKIIPSAGSKQDFGYKWLNSNNQVLSNSDTLSYYITKADILKAVLTYNCNGKSDTSIIRLNLPLPISSKIIKPDCFDSSITLIVNASGGYKNSISHVWYKDKKAINLGKQITVSGIHKKQWINVLTTDFCNTIIKDSVHLFPRPKAAFEILEDSICQLEPIHLKNQSLSFTSSNHVQLNVESSQIAWRASDTIVTMKNIGNQVLRLEIKDSLGCSDNASASVFVVEKPNADFRMIPEIVTVDNGSFELIPLETTNIKYHWKIGNILDLTHHSWQSLRLPIEDTASYFTTLIVTNSFGCRDTVSKTINIRTSDAFFIPNAVSRNDDGLNDEFAPYGWKVQSYQMLIVARTNQVVYKGSTPWKPEFEDGVYSYVIKVKFKDGTENTFKGHVHVIH